MAHFRSSSLLRLPAELRREVISHLDPRTRTSLIQAGKYIPDINEYQSGLILARNRAFEASRERDYRLVEDIYEDYPEIADTTMYEYSPLDLATRNAVEDGNI